MMTRRLLNLVTALSLLLSAVVVALWATDHGGTTSREISFATGHKSYGLFFDGDNFFCGAFGSEAEGNFGLSVQTNHRYTASLYCLAVLSETQRIWPHFGGFGAVRVDAPPGELFRCASILMFPWWVGPAVLLPLPAARLVHLLRDARRRKSPGQCLSCGYDLRATPDRCPECGSAGFHEARSGRLTHQPDSPAPVNPPASPVSPIRIPGRI